MSAMPLFRWMSQFTTSLSRIADRGVARFRLWRCEVMRSHLAATRVVLAAVAMLAMNPVCAAPKDEIRGAFSKFVAAQNAHNLKAVGELLSDSPNFLWIAPGRIVRSRDAALDRFGELFQSTWRVDPDWSTFEIMMLDVSTAELFVRVSTAIGSVCSIGADESDHDQ